MTQIADAVGTIRAALLQSPQSIHHVAHTPCPALHKAIADLGRVCTGLAWRHSFKEGKHERHS